MKIRATVSSMLRAGLTLGFALGIAGSALNAATYISNSPDPFASPNFGLGIPGAGIICFTGLFCTSDNISHDYQETSKVFQNGNEYVTTTATFSGNIYDANQNFLGAYSAQGNVDFTIFGNGVLDPRDSDSVGTWDAQITRDDFSLNIFGHTFAITLDSAQTSNGQITVTSTGSQQILNSPADPPYDAAQYRIDQQFAVNALLTADPAQGGPSNAPFQFGLSALDTSAAPEPASALLLLVPFSAIALRKRLNK